MKTPIKLFIPFLLTVSLIEPYFKKNDEETELHCEKESVSTDCFNGGQITHTTGATVSTIVNFQFGNKSIKIEP